MAASGNESGEEALWQAAKIISGIYVAKAKAAGSSDWRNDDSQHRKSGVRRHATLAWQRGSVMKNKASMAAALALPRGLGERHRQRSQWQIKRIGIGIIIGIGVGIAAWRSISGSWPHVA